MIIPDKIISIPSSIFQKPIFENIYLIQLKNDGFFC